MRLPGLRLREELKYVKTENAPVSLVGSGGVQFVKKHAYGGFFDDFCTVCLGAYGSPGGKRRAAAFLLNPLLRKGSVSAAHVAGNGLAIGGLRPSNTSGVL